jgi:hypothetical protein
MVKDANGREGLSTGAIAKELEASPGAVKKALSAIGVADADFVKAGCGYYYADRLPAIKGALKYTARRIAIEAARIRLPIRSALGRDDALAQHEAAVEAALTRLDDGIRAAREIVEGEALDADHRSWPPLGPVDLGLDLGLHGRDLVRLAADLHAPCKSSTNVSSGSTERMASTACAAVRFSIRRRRPRTVARAIESAGKFVSDTMSTSPCPMARRQPSTSAFSRWSIPLSISSLPGIPIEVTGKGIRRRRRPSGRRGE